MNKIKLVSLILGITAFVLTGLFSVQSVKAQNTSGSMLIATPYERGQKLDFFFNNSTTPLDFFEVPEVTPVFLSIVTPEQLDSYKKAGYNPVIVDKEAGNINQYYLLYGKRFENDKQYALLKDDVQANNGLELAYPVTNYTTLVKVAPGMNLDQLKLKDLNRSHPRQLVSAITPPPSRITSSTKKTTTKVRTILDDEDWVKYTNILSAVALLLFLAIVVIQYRRNR